MTAPDRTAGVPPRQAVAPTAHVADSWDAARLAAMFDAAARGTFPEADGRARVADSGAPVGALVATTRWFAVAANVTPQWLAGVLDPGWPSPFTPAAVAAIAARTGCAPGENDVVLAALASGTGPDPRWAPAPEEHPRVRAARASRREVRAWQVDDAGSVLCVGRGLAGRWEVSLEVAQARRGAGLGTALAGRALAVLPAGTPVFAQVTAGNVASLRAFLTAGYRPVGQEVRLFPRDPAAASTQDDA